MRQALTSNALEIRSFFLRTRLLVHQTVIRMEQFRYFLIELHSKPSEPADHGPSLSLVHVSHKKQHSIVRCRGHGDGGCAHDTSLPSCGQKVASDFSDRGPHVSSMHGDSSTGRFGGISFDPLGFRRVPSICRHGVASANVMHAKPQVPLPPHPHGLEFDSLKWSAKSDEGRTRVQRRSKECPLHRGRCPLGLERVEGGSAVLAFVH